jgi:hypothetical protein
VQLRIGLDVQLSKRGSGESVGPAIGEERVQDGSGVLAQVAARTAVQDEVGEGSGHASDCTREAGFARPTQRCGGPA